MLKDKIHLMLLFLSPYQPDRETNRLTRNVFYGSGFLADDCIHTNESALRYTMDTIGDLDKIFMFVSSKVKGALKYIDDYGTAHETTHLTHFKEAMGVLYGHKDFGTLLVTEEYKETIIDKDELEAGDADFNINAADFEAVVNLSRKIKAFAKPYLDDGTEVVLHVDMTGGFRHASLLMLSVVELLKYSGIRIENIFYANLNMSTKIGKIEDAKRIHNVFQLVAGAEAFVKYGSVKVLKEYFDGISSSAALDRLLDCMRVFEEALKLCRTGIILKVSNKLKLAIDEYKLNYGASMEERLFRGLLDTIEREYSAILKNEDVTNAIEIIRWCVRKGFLQQALTFYTEWIPEYLVKKKIVFPTKDEVIRACSESKKDYESWEKHMLSSYVKQYNTGAVIRGTVLKNVRQYYKEMSEGSKISSELLLAVIRDSAPDVCYAMRVLEDEVRAYQQIKDEKDAKRKINGSDLKMTYEFLYMQYHSNPNSTPKEPMHRYWLSRFSKPAGIYGALSRFSNDGLAKLFGIDESNKESRQDLNSAYAAMVKKMFDEEELGSSVQVELATECCVMYDEIRDLRNNINHANTDIDTYSFDKVREVIENALDRLERAQSIGEEK